MSDEPRAAGSGKTSLTARLFDGMQNLIAGLGNSRDKRSYGTYTTSLPLNQLEAESLYSSSWLADKIVNVIPDDMTREWVDLSWDGADKDPQEKKRLKDAADEFDLRAKTNEAAKWARLYGGAVILIGLNGEDLSTPLNMATIKKGSLKYLKVLDRWRCTPDGALDDRLGPNFDLPVYYRESRSGMRIHYSRLVRFDGRKLPWREKIGNSGWDGSVLQPMMDSIRDYDFTRAGISSMVYEASVDVIGVDGLYDMLATKEGEAQLTARFVSAGTLKSVNQMLIIDKEKESFNQKTTSFSGVNEVFEKVSMIDVAGGGDIPVTRLFGRSPGGMNATGDSDAKNYENRVAAEQTTKLRPPLKVLYEVLVRSTLGRLPENFDFTFRPLSQIGATDKATIQKSNADRDKVYVELGVLSEGAVARQLKDDNVYSTLEEEDVRMAEELSKQVEPEPAAPGAEPPVPAKAAPGKSAPPLEE